MQLVVFFFVDAWELIDLWRDIPYKIRGSPIPKKRVGAWVESG